MITIHEFWNSQDFCPSNIPTHPLRRCHFIKLRADFSGAKDGAPTVSRHHSLVTRKGTHSWMRQVIKELLPLCRRPSRRVTERPVLLPQPLPWPTWTKSIFSIPRQHNFSV